MDGMSYGVILVAVIVGIIQAAKIAGFPTKYCPLLATGIGLVLGILLLSEGDWKRGIILGLACGLSACGLYDNGKKLTS